MRQVKGQSTKDGILDLNIIKASKILLNISYTCANVPLSVRSFILRMRYAKDLRRIRLLKGSYIGKRCFVVGNGPSLNRINLEKLIDENLITVNMFFRHPYYDRLSPMFHCAIDPAMYVGEIGQDFLDVIESHQETSFLISSKAPNDIRTQPNCYTTILGYLPSSKCHPYDLSKPSAAFVNVVLVAIELAIYLGFKEIILLGCDFSQFAVRKAHHSYREMGSDERTATMFQDLQGHAIAIMQHEWLFSYAKKKKVTIVNSTEGSYLDVYPKRNINSII